jgi:hypothetical protein
MKAPPLALIVLAACSPDAPPPRPPVAGTPARKAAHEFAAANPQFAVVLVRPDGASFQVLDRESGVLFLMPIDARAVRVRATPCPNPPLLSVFPGELDRICLEAAGRRALAFRAPATTPIVAAHYEWPEPDSELRAHFRSGVLRVWLDRRVGTYTRVFAIE